MSLNTKSVESRLFIPILFLFYVYVAIVSMPPIWDTDIWWHLRVGEWIIQNHSFPKFDMFSSIHPGREWRTFNWLFEVLIYELHQKVGLLGLRIFFALLITGSFGLWLRYFKLLSSYRVVWFFLLTLLLTLYADRLRIRPHIINLPFEALLFIFLQKGGQLSSWSKRLSFFSLAVVWSNFHNPCAALGAGVVILNSALHVALLWKDPKAAKKDYIDFVWPAALSALAIVCNPYGANLIWAGMVNIAPVYQAGIEGEWVSSLTHFFKSKSFFEKFVSIVPFITLLSATCLFLRKIAKEKLLKTANDDFIKKSIGSFLFLILSQTAVRFIYLSTPMISRMGCNLYEKFTKFRFVFVPLSVGMILISHAHLSDAQGGMKNMIKNLAVNIMPDRNPDVGIKLIRETGVQGKIFSPVSWGGYILWFAHPKGGVSEDGRNNFSADVMKMQSFGMRAMGIDGDKVIQSFDAMDVDIAIIPTGAFPYHHWPVKEWIRVAYDPIAEVFIRTSDLSDLSRIKKWVGATSNDPVEIQKAATVYFGEQYYGTMKEELKKMDADVSKETIHDRISIETMAAHDEQAIDLLALHLQAVPNCIRAATELAEILHDQGRYKNAWELLSPVINTPNLPLPTQRLMDHLRTHI